MNLRKRSLLSFTQLQTLAGFAMLAYASTVTDLTTPLILLSSLFLALGISTSVHNAEVIAKRVGPSLGTLILAIAVTIIEVALIVNLMSDATSPKPTLARDTVFSAIMIVTNGIAGVSILLGGLRQKELVFQTLGTSSFMAALAALAILTMVLPNYTTSTSGPTFSPAQLVLVSIFAIIIYFSLVWAQTKSHKDYFEPVSHDQLRKLVASEYVPSNAQSIVSFIGLLISLTIVVGFAKVLSPSISGAMQAVGAPASSVGIVVALLVLAPETLAAMNAAKANQLQTSLNLALGSGVASIALTIPVVSLFSILAGETLILGLDPKGMTFLALTFLAGCFTFSSGRTTALHGIVHLVILLSYIVISLVP